MSVALELWRALEAWDPDRHPRGPGGRFIKALGSSRPSLADVVRGTAAGGPKRQRTDRGGMTVGDAVRAAARQSDTTGRPTQRPVAEHRAHGAHDVADEVDRALADAGVPEDVRRQVAGRARAAADSHGARPDSLPNRPDSLPKPSKKLAKLSDQQLERGLQMHGNQTPRGKEIQAEVIRRQVDTAPAVSNPDAVKADIRSAVSRLQQEQGGWVGLADLREQLGDGRSREDVDAALLDLLDEPGVRIIPVANSKALKPRDREAAVRIGGEDNHAISISGPAPAPKAAAHNAPAHDAAVRDAYSRLAAQPGDFVSLADLRAELGGMSREEQDNALKRLMRHPDFLLEEETNQKALKLRDRNAAINVGARDQHAIAIRPPEPGRPRQRRAPRAFTAADAATVASHLETATSRDDARARLKDLTAPQLRQIAEMLGATVGANYTKPKLIDRLVEIPGRRLDRNAIDSMARKP